MASDISKKLVAKRYAQALYEQASEASALKKVNDDLNSLSGLMQDQIIEPLSDPTISKDDITDGVVAVAKKAKCCQTTVNFLKMLVQSDRLKILEHVAQQFKKKFNQEQNRHIVTVRAAKALTKSQLGRLEKGLVGLFGKGSKIDIKTDVDPALIGGIELQYDDILIDNTFRHRLELMASDMKGTL